MICGFASVLVVDDDAAFVLLIFEILRFAGFRVRTAATGVTALELARADRPHVVLLDVNLADISGYEVCRRLRDDYGDGIGVVFLSGARTEPYDRTAGLLVGADDYLAKPCDPGELVARIRRLAERVSGSAATDQRPELGALTPRELEILELLAAGSDQVGIARELVISPKTVSTHIQRILGKLGVHSRAQAVAIAHRSGLVETDVASSRPIAAA